jgi:hypothetical protein
MVGRNQGRKKVKRGRTKTVFAVIPEPFSGIFGENRFKIIIPP